MWSGCPPCRESADPTQPRVRRHWQTFDQPVRPCRVGHVGGPGAGASPLRRCRCRAVAAGCTDRWTTHWGAAQIYGKKTNCSGSKQSLASSQLNVCSGRSRRRNDGHSRPVDDAGSEPMLTTGILSEPSDDRCRHCLTPFSMAAFDNMPPRPSCEDGRVSDGLATLTIFSIRASIRFRSLLLFRPSYQTGDSIVSSSHGLHAPVTEKCKTVEFFGFSEASLTRIQGHSTKCELLLKTTSCNVNTILKCLLELLHLLSVVLFAEIYK